MNQPTTYGLPNKREEVIKQLNLAYSEQNLEEEEFESRLKEAINAKSIEELKLVIFDFPIAIQESIFPKASTLPAKSQPPSYPAVPSHRNKIQTILGEDARTLPNLQQNMPKFSTILGDQKLDFRLSQILDDTIYLRFESILGNTTVDLRNEALEGKVLNIHITGSLGDIKILLPRGANIQKNIQSVMGDFKIQDKNRSWIKRITGLGKQQEPESIRFTVNVTGTYWLGNIKFVY